MSEEDLFFVARSGFIWACWLSGKPAVNLGSELEVRAAMARFSVLSGALADDAAEADRVEPASPPQPPVAPPKPPRRARDRTEKRHEVSVPGRLFSTFGRRDVRIHDLSEQGCRFRDDVDRLDEGDAVTIKLGEVGPLAATVMWRRDGFVGVRFNTPLYPSVMAHIRDQFSFGR
jgi:hypothetical protein